jgi:YVTN family beta-propeller protein
MKLGRCSASHLGGFAVFFGLVFLGITGAFFGQPQTPEPKPQKATPVLDDHPAAAKFKATPRTLDDGRYLLPNGWHLSPAGRQIALGGLPLKIVACPDKRHLLVLSCGATPHFLAVVDATTEEIVQRRRLKQCWFGLAVHPNGKTDYVAAGAEDAIRTFDLSNRLAEGKTIALPKKTFPSGLALDREGKRLFVVGNQSHALHVIDVPSGTELFKVPVGQDPYNVVLSADEKTAYVSNWGAASVAVIDLVAAKVRQTIPTQEHPNDLVLHADGRLFVANGNRNTVSVIDTCKGEAIEQIDVGLTAKAPPGSTPNALVLSADGKTLYVANADNNVLAVLDVARKGETSSRGFIPTGWYPTAVCLTSDGKKLVVANGKGAVSKPNAALVRPSELPSYRADHPGYDINLLEGTVSIIDVPDEKTLARYSVQAHRNSPYGKIDPNAIKTPFSLGKDCPIKYVIYIIKENRTYDQVFGDMKEGNGDARYCLFPEEVTPNHHALARQFVLLDNCYHDAEVSMDGHHWVTGAYATDYVEKLWPARYGRRSVREPDGETANASSPYLWQLCQAAGLHYRSYGETTGMPPEVRRTEKPVPRPSTAKHPKKAAFPPKQGIDPLDLPLHPTYDAWKMGDTKALELWQADFAQYEKRGRMPRLQVISLPGDHTNGTSPKHRTPRAMVAENDLALGKLVEAVSRSKFWHETAIFVIEDDPQDGPDHVDVHRTVALVVSPYTKRNYVDSTMYSSSSLLRTMELILGLPPMTQYDAAATPMWASFQAKQVLTSYRAMPARVNLNEMNMAAAYGAERSLAMDFDEVDHAPMAELNEILWKSIKGVDNPMPPRRVAAFVRVREKEDEKKIHP